MYYLNRKVLLASKHEKEQAIAPVFSNELQCQICVEDFDTDQFGSFTGEIARPLPAYETCVLKAKTAAEQFNYNLSIASEGSFGPHPSIPFIPCDYEIMVFIDKLNNWVISEQIRTEKTNYKMITIDKQTELDSFLKQVGFPKHALTLQSTTEQIIIAKGIRTADVLFDCLKKGFKLDNHLLLATDMRAMMNPTRMKVISQLANKLASRINSYCPKCKSPGFGFKTTTGHLPCKQCNSLTSFYEQEIWACIQCEQEEAKPRRDNLKNVEPSYCTYCNP